MISRKPKTHTNITPRQLQVLRQIAEYISRNGYSPTIARIAKELGIARSTVFEHIGELRKKALLRNQPGRAHSLSLTEKAGELLENLDSHRSPENPNEVKLLGKIAAGQPLLAVEDERKLALDDLFDNDESTFALQVSGESMKGEGIFDGDYVICRKADTARNGQLVVAIIDKDNATLKRFYKEKNRVRLQPANPDFEPIYTKNCRIQAVAVGLIRNSV